MSIVKIDIEKFRSLLHDIRRAKRSSEFAPLDIEATIPFKAEATEFARQAIREKYTKLQNEIDSSDILQLKTIYNYLLT